MKDHYSFIHDESQIKRFHNLLSTQESSEVYFLSMSSRQKYLTEEERRYYDIGRNEMFARKLVKTSDFATYLRVVRTFEVSYGGYTSKNNLPLPEKSLVVYANINPLSGEKALKEFYSKTNEILFDLSNNEQAREGLSKLDTLLMNCYQKARARKTLIDIDLDTKRDDILLELLSRLKSQSVTYEVIETKSGFHVLLKKSTVKFNYPEIVAQLDKRVKESDSKGEVTVNKNDMVPLPGTFQAGFPVRFVTDQLT